MADSELQTLLVQHKKYFTTQADGKIHCSLNNHCFPARLDVIGAFVKGPKYQKLITLHNAEISLTKYEPFIIRSKNFPNKLFCTLTIQLLDQSLESIKTHMRGQKFRRARDKYLEDKAELKDEPDMPGPGDKPKPEPKEGDDADEDRLGGSEGDESGGGEGESEDGGRESSPMMMEDEEDSEGEEGAELSDDEEIVFDDVFGDGESEDEGNTKDGEATASVSIPAPSKSEKSKPETNGKAHQKQDKKGSKGKGADKDADVAASSKAAVAATAGSAAEPTQQEGSKRKEKKQLWKQQQQQQQDQLQQNQQESEPSKASKGKGAGKRGAAEVDAEAGAAKVEAVGVQPQTGKQSKKAKLVAEKAQPVVEDAGAATVEVKKVPELPAVVDKSAKPPKKQKPPRPVSTKKAGKKVTA
ncbi:MAG: hypothetical protein WDW38_004757 [Sanguina aurantia]